MSSSRGESPSPPSFSTSSSATGLEKPPRGKPEPGGPPPGCPPPPPSRGPPSKPPSCRPSRKAWCIASRRLWLWSSSNRQTPTRLSGPGGAAGSAAPRASGAQRRPAGRVAARSERSDRRERVERMRTSGERLGSPPAYGEPAEETSSGGKGVVSVVRNRPAARVSPARLLNSQPMREPWQRPGPRGGAELAPRLAVLALVGLLAALAVLQWRWIGEVSHLERERQRASLGAAGERVASTLDREVLRAFFYFHAPPPGGTAPRERRIAERLDLWRRDAPWPELVRAVYTFDPAAGTLALAIPAEGRFRPVPWPAALAPARARIERGVRVPELEPRGPALLIPFDFAPRVRLAPASPGQVAVVLFDREVIARRILPGLVEREFSLSRAPELLVAVTGPDGLLYRSDPGLPAARYAGSDLRLPMFGLRETRDLHELMPFPSDWLHGFGHLGRDRQPADRPLRRFGPPSGAEGAWQIVVSHRAGSLEAAVAHARWHNFAISLGILALLAASLLVLARSAERARRLARQRLELVAGVTHELNTPLAAMRAAAQNLADGVVV